MYLNRTSIEWCDFTWNPVTGCRQDCEYCRAKKIAQSSKGKGGLDRKAVAKYRQKDDNYVIPEALYSDKGKKIPFPVGFTPTLHEYRLDAIQKTKKPSIIYVCNMTDLFAEDIPTEWILRVFDECRKNPAHTYVFLTRNPNRYTELDKANILPTNKNFWYGTTITESEQPYFKSKLHNTLLNFDPLMSEIKYKSPYEVDWIIVGVQKIFLDMPRRNIQPKTSWLTNIIDKAYMEKIPVFLRSDNILKQIWRRAIPNQYPDTVKRKEISTIPRCKYCSSCIAERFYDETTKYCIGYLNHKEKRKILYKDYYKGSPDWCPKVEVEKKLLSLKQEAPASTLCVNDE